MRILVVDADVLDVALAFGAVVGFGCVVAMIVGALATSKIPTPLPTPHDYYVGRDDLGNEYLVAVPESSADSATLPNSPAESADNLSVPVEPSPAADRETPARDAAAEKASPNPTSDARHLASVPCSSVAGSAAKTDPAPNPLRNV